MFLLYLILILDWPMYGRDLCNTHSQEGKGAMTTAVIKWSYNTGSSGQIEFAPTLADINNDGYLEIIAHAHAQGKVYTFDYAGTLLWTYTAGDYILASSSTADIDGDGYNEIMFGDYSGKLYAINHDGSFLWSYMTGSNTGWSAATVADIDNDGFYEVMIGNLSNKLYAINHDGSFLWSYTTGGGVSTPAVADINNDGWYEIVFGSADSNVYALTHDGLLIWNYSVGNLDDRRAAPGIADIDGDGYDEVIIGSCDYGSGRVYAINHDGTLLWTYNIGGAVHCAVAIGDVDGDGWHEIISPKITYGGVNEIYCLNHDGTLCWSITLQRDIHDAAIGDIDCDSCLEVVVGTHDGSYLYVLDDPANTSGCWPVGVDEEVAEGFGLRGLELRVSGGRIIFSIPSSGTVSLKLYDICGRLVKEIVNKKMNRGNYTVDIGSLSSGIYFVVLTHPIGKVTRKFISVR